MSTEISALFNQQKQTSEGFFDAPNFALRKKSLKSLSHALDKYESQLLEALRLDLGKNETEAYCTEILPLKNEISTALKSLKDWMRSEPKKLPVLLKPSTAELIPRPKGRVLIIGPFNYPVNLALRPLIGALAAGNTVILKPSEHTPHVSNVLSSLIQDSFQPDQVALLQGGKEVVEQLLELPFDHFFFTGSEKVGKIVYQKAASHMATVTLELGGKSPLIVWPSVSITQAVRKIVWGKFVNFGQTCVAPDYAIVHKDIMDEFVNGMINEIRAQFSDEEQPICCSQYYGKCVSQHRQETLVEYLQDVTILSGGFVCEKCQKLAPTLVTDIPDSHPLRTEEIFGPDIGALQGKML